MEKKFCCLEHRVFGQVYIFGVHGPEAYDAFCVRDQRVRALLSAEEYWLPVRKTDEPGASEKQLARAYRAWVKSFKKPKLKIEDRLLVAGLDETVRPVPLCQTIPKRLRQTPPKRVSGTNHPRRLTAGERDVPPRASCSLSIFCLGDARARTKGKTMHFF